MSGRDNSLPMIKDKNQELFERLVDFCNKGEFRCKRHQKFIRGYFQINQLNLTLAEMGLEEDMIQLVCYESSLEHEDWC